MMFSFLFLLLLSLSVVALKKNEVLRRTDCPFFFLQKTHTKKNLDTKVKSLSHHHHHHFLLLRSF